MYSTSCYVINEITYSRQGTRKSISTKLWLDSNEVRKKAENELGEKFDLRAFHDLLLSNGSVPLFILEEMVEGWIKEKKQAKSAA